MRSFYLRLSLGGLCCVLLTACGAETSTDPAAVALLRDPGGTFTIEQVSSPHLLAEFRPVPPGMLSLGYSDAVHWLRITAPPGAQDILEISFPILDDVTLYTRTAAGGFRARATGDSRVFSTRETPDRGFVFRLDATAAGQPLYLRVRTRSSLVIPLRFWSEEKYHTAHDLDLLLLGAYYGAISIMILFNLFLFVSLRHGMYLWYVAYVACYSLYLFSWNGLAFQYFWPDSPVLNDHINPVLIGLSNAAALWFARRFYRSAFEMPVLNRLLYAGIGICGLVVVCGLLGRYSLALRLSVPTVIITTLLIILCSFVQWCRGFQPARFYLLAFAVLGCGIIVNALRAVGLLPANFFTLLYGFQLASIAEILILSFALADRNRAAESERRARLAASEARSTFMANMSHEMRTPLTAILGMGELLGETSLNPEQKKFLSVLQRAGQGLLALVNDVLDLTRLQSDRVELESISFDVLDLCQTCRQMLAPLAEEKAVQLRFVPAPQLSPLVLGDPLRVQRILVNLVHNAVKFTEAGSVELRVERSDPQRLHFEVRDTGIGIPPERLQRIFEPFTQADESISRRFGGTGLGLAIAREIIERLGGRIIVESSPARGTSFHVWIPLPAVTDQASAKPVQPPAPAPVQSGRLRVLLAEDNADNRMLVANFLRDTPYELDMAENGAEAIESYRSRQQSSPYDIILMDIQMPVVDGITAVRAIRKIERETPHAESRPIRIYAFTAHAMKEEIDRTIEAGCDGAITKPVRRRDLLALLESVSRPGY